MDKLKNPFTPGAGAYPPELAGRENVLEAGRIVAGRTLLGRYEKGLMLIGLRGVGKTVLLKNMAENSRLAGIVPVMVEVRNAADDMEELSIRIKEALTTIDFKSKVKSSVNLAYSVLKNFVRSIAVNIGEFGVSVEVDHGLGRTGSMEFDLSEVLMATARAAKQSGTAVGLYIDELQNLNVEAVRGIIVALHHAAQELLPLYLIGSGLPSIRSVIGKSKTYAERMFNYEEIGALDFKSTQDAIVRPLSAEGISIETSVLEKLYGQTGGYPYFLQEWGYQLWVKATGTEITEKDMSDISEVVFERLDRNFFDVRFDRVSILEREVLLAMAADTDREVAIADVAARMGRSQTAMSAVRASLIRKGMVYSSSYGRLSYTVPLFAEYLNRKVRVASPQ